MRPEDGYPESLRNAVYERIRAGTTVRELMEQFGIGWGTCYRWLEQLRSQGEPVSFRMQVDQFKEAAFERFRAGASIGEVQDELGVRRDRLFRWHEEFVGMSEAGGSSSGQAPPQCCLERPVQAQVRQASTRKQDALIQQLKTALAEKTMEADFFKGALQEVEGRRNRSITNGETPSTDNSDR